MTKHSVAQDLSNVTAIPGRTAEWNEKALSGLRRLEALITDLAHMTEIAGDVIEQTLDQKDAKQVGDTTIRSYRISDGEVNKVMFAIYHAQGMAQDLEKAFYAALEH